MEEEKVKSKSKNSKKKTAIIIAVVLVIFLSANVFAGTLGYNNIFFAINRLFNPNVEVYDPSEILSDSDITISYKPIEISEGLNIQINRLVVKDNEATLYMNINQANAVRKPFICLVHDITDGEGTLIGNEEISSGNSDRFDFQMELVGMKNTSTLLEIEFQDDEYSTIAVLNLDLKNKEINIVAGEMKELQKISEVELKSVLENYVKIHMIEDLDSIAEGIHTADEYRNEEKVIIAIDAISPDVTFKEASAAEVHKVIKELTGEEITEPLSLSNLLIKYDSKKDVYKYFGPRYYGNSGEGRKALVIDITDLNYINGIYTATFTYCYPFKDDYENNNIENLPLFSATMSLEINSNYKYLKYRIVDGDNFRSGEPIEVNNSANTNSNTVNISTNTVTNTISNTVVNTSTNTITNTVSNTVRVPSNTNTVTNTSTATNTVRVPNNNTNTVTNTATAIIQNTVPNNSTVPNLDISKVDNYASTMSWSKLYTPGLKSKVPSNWNVEVYKDIYSGEQDTGTIATKVEGWATGINRDTNQIVNSYVTMNYYMPEFTDCKSIEEYAQLVAERYGMSFGRTGYGERNSHELSWAEVYGPYDSSSHVYFCHFEPLDNGEHGVGYIVEFITDNPNNYKVTNILNWIFGDLKTTSF